MEIYFGSFQLPEASLPQNLVAFTIPDLGVKFKAPFKAKDLALDYASLLTLLEFVEVNPQLFANRALEIYCNNFDLVSQVKEHFVNDKGLIPYLQKALDYKSKLNYSINWVAQNDNPAQNPKID